MLKSHELTEKSDFGYDGYFLCTTVHCSA